jgi:flagellar assembly protein FliH
MSHWLPKEKLTAYQRWEVAAFDEEQRAAKTSAALAPPVIEAAPAAVAEVAAEEPQESVVLPTAADIERMHSEAQAAGYAAGYGAGYGEGITAAQVSAAAIATLMDQLTQALVAIDQEVADQLLALAVEIAQQVLRQSLRLQPELILPVVREAVTTLHPHHGQPLLFVHPDDALLVRSQLGEQLAHSNWRIIEESTLSPGGCRVELGASEVDATIETRWRRVLAALDVSDEWLKGPGMRSHDDR